MAASTTPEQIRKSICDTVSIHQIDEGIFAVDLPLAFPDSDQCRVFVERKSGTEWNVFDAGSSIQRAAYESETDVLGRGYADRLRQILAFYGISEDMGELSINADNLGGAVFTMTQAALEIVNLSRTPKDKESKKTKNLFSSKLSKIITHAVPESTYTSRWTDKLRDEDSLYPVDYRIECASARPLFVFGAGTRAQCMHATMSCLFHKSGSDFRSIAVFDDIEELPRGEVQRLKGAVDQTFATIREAEAIQQCIAELSI